jgi:flagellar biosynthesis GTPase FlhF
MEVRTFRAGTLQEALQLVRHTLGPDAAVLTTRNLRVNRLGLFPTTMIEVEASVDRPTKAEGEPLTPAVATPPATDSSRLEAVPANPEKPSRVVRSAETHTASQAEQVDDQLAEPVPAEGRRRKRTATTATSTTAASTTAAGTTAATKAKRRPTSATTSQDRIHVGDLPDDATDDDDLAVSKSDATPVGRSRLRDEHFVRPLVEPGQATRLATGMVGIAGGKPTQPCFRC